MAVVLLTGCQSDLRDDVVDENQGTDVPDDRTDGQTDDQTGDQINDQNDNNTTTDQFSIILESDSIELVEGNGVVSLPITITRNADFTGDIALSTSTLITADENNLTRQLTDSLISTDEQGAELEIALAIGPRPIQPEERLLRISATAPSGQVNSRTLAIQVQPTLAPDVYLLIGQSNMVGISEIDARQSDIGGADEPVERIRQLNVTFNDPDNFPDADAFTQRENLFNTGEPLTRALDPLHSGLQSNGSKSGTRIGLGLSFAKRALIDTSAEIFLVPAAWSDTGFCNRDTNTLPGLGWNATPQSDPAFAGTLLHDRAIARANFALELTGGVLRGILWHQGEADSDDATCASSYASNLTQLIESLRSNIAEDARGAVARGPDADIPFIVGTMSIAEEQSPFSETKQFVDTAHRTISSAVNYTAHVNSDDLTPPSFDCGGGSCIHFGADALREMGSRYYESLISVLP